MWCYGLWGFGVRPADTAYVAFGYGSFIGFWGLHYGMEKMGVLNVARRRPDYRGVGSSRSWTSGPRWSPPPLPTPCGWPRRPSAVVDLAASGVQRLILSGEPAGVDPPDQGPDRAALGAKAGDTAGMTEIGTIMIFERRHRMGAPTSSRPLHRGGGRPGLGRAGSATARRGACDLPSSRHHPAAALPHRRPGGQGAGRPLCLRARLRPVRGRHPGPGRRHEAGPGDQRLPAGGGGGSSASSRAWRSSSCA